MGDYAIERFLIAFVILILILLVFVFTKKKRRIFIGLIIAVLVGYGIFFFVRGLILENQYTKSVETVNEYLVNHYPEEEWTVIDRLSKGQLRKGNKVAIVFPNEKEVIFTYKNMDNGEVVQWEINLGGKSINDLLHDEKSK